MDKEYMNYLKQVKRNLTNIFIVQLYKNKGDIEKTIKDFNDDVNDESENINKLINENIPEKSKEACRNEIFKNFEVAVIEVMDIFFNEKNGLITNNKHEELGKLMEEAIEYSIKRKNQIENEFSHD